MAAPASSPAPTNGNGVPTNGNAVHTLLIATTDEDHRAFLAAQLDGDGHIVYEADSAAGAVAKLSGPRDRRADPRAPTATGRRSRAAARGA